MFYSLHFTRYSLFLLVTRCFFTRYSLLFTRYSLFFTLYVLLFTRYFYSLLVAFLLVTRYFLLVTHYFFTHYFYSLYFTFYLSLIKLFSFVKLWKFQCSFSSHWGNCCIHFDWLMNCCVLRRISCHGRNHSQASCEYSLTIFLCCQHHSEYSLLGSKFSTNLLFAASKCHVTIQQRGSSRCSKWPNRMGSLQW